MIKKTFITLVIFIGFCFVLTAQQISTSNNMSLDALIQNTLGQGCVEITNIASTINGSVNDLSSYGSFTRENSNFPFQNGLVLTTGNVYSAGNVLNTVPLNEGNTSWSADPDLETALGISNTMNATSIEFEFVSAANQIAFNYLLASEEYLGTNPCNYSDGFAFLIKKAGTSDPYQNIALIPGTSLPVNTTNIHSEITGFCPAENPSYFQGYNLGDTNYNGRTTVLTASATIVPNVAYHIKIVVADQGDPNFDSAVFIEGNSFNAKVDLGPDIATCAKTTTLNGSIDNPLATYKWFRNGSVISGAINSSLNVTQSGNYKVVASVKLNSKICEFNDTILVSLNVQQTLENIPDYFLCDDLSQNGKEFFDLSTRNNDVLAVLAPSNYRITYHLTSSDANDGSNPITIPIQNSESPQQIYIRIEDRTKGCLSFSGVRLIVNQPPTINRPIPFKVCDTDGVSDGKIAIDLKQFDAEITNNAPNLFVSYHKSNSDANSGANSILLPYTNEDPNETIYIRVYDANTGCFSTTTLNITVSKVPEQTIEKPFLNACTTGGNGFATFNLTPEFDRVLAGLTHVSGSIHETYDDAELDQNRITNKSNFQNTKPFFQEIFIRLVDNNTGCFSIVTLELHTNIVQTGFYQGVFNGCDDASLNGIVDFDLGNIEFQLLNGYDGFDVDFFNSQSDQQNNTDPIDKTIPFTVNSSTKVIYASVKSAGCVEFIPINLVINPPVAITAFTAVDHCDTDQNGYAEIFLPDYDNHVNIGISNPIVNYYRTENDAINNENILEDYFYNIERTEIIYVRVTNSQTFCYDIAPLTINVLDAPIIIGPDTITVCDNDLDGYVVVDLESRIPDLVPDTAGLTITFHTNYNLAVAGTNPIPDPAAYNSPSQYIAVRVENNATGCYSIAALYVKVNTLPQFTNISSFKNCTSEGNKITDFYFYEKDDEILNGQTDKQVLYFENAQDADNRVNMIDKFSAYQNTSSDAQIIYVRVEAETDESCYGTSSFTLEVDILPPFNAPIDEFLCDDLSNDGFVTIDLNAKKSEILNGITEPLDVTFFTSIQEAKNKNNPISNLSFTNTVNPQAIYALIDNGTYCYSVTSFSINVVPLPAVKEPSILEACDTDYDGLTTFDLKVVEIEVLDVRQDNILITYHESLQGAETDTEIISDPENYTNTANPQIVYVRINNTVSNCYINLPITIKANLPATIMDIKTYPICENPNNNFDLSTIDDSITSENGIEVSYFKSHLDALKNENPFNSNYTYTSTNDHIYARLENSLTGCLSYYDFELAVNPMPEAKMPNDLYDCDDDYDGFLVFDLSQQSVSILNGQDPDDYKVSYHSDIASAENGTDILENLYSATNDESIYARVTNSATGCFNITQFSVIIHPKPLIDIPDRAICIDNLPLVVSANTNMPGDTYQWSSGETTPEIQIQTLGSYTVIVTSNLGCETTREFNVVESESAVIESTETIDFSDPNNITITVSGTGNYRYVLDDGPPQESNVFQNVTIGYHTITIIDLNGCAEVSKEVVVIDAPKFVTPNNDGFFDTWHISGIETLPGSVIYVYDRYGKLLTTLTSSSPGWDGTYNGNKMPSSDYWFLGKIIKNGNTFDVKGHFALKL